ncbi:hypothetical protein HZS_6900 [Henneguya salminicola]|nr:hypothetical protein HZS_6900 [Henneguya salminicola]
MKLLIVMIWIESQSAYKYILIYIREKFLFIFDRVGHNIKSSANIQSLTFHIKIVAETSTVCTTKVPCIYTHIVPFISEQMQYTLFYESASAKYKNYLTADINNLPDSFNLNFDVYDTNKIDIAVDTKIVTFKKEMWLQSDYADFYILKCYEELRDSTASSDEDQCPRLKYLQLHKYQPNRIVNFAFLTIGGQQNIDVKMGGLYFVLNFQEYSQKTILNMHTNYLPTYFDHKPCLTSSLKTSGACPESSNWLENLKPIRTSYDVDQTELSPQPPSQSSVNIEVLFFKNRRITKINDHASFDICIDDEETEKLSSKCSSGFKSSPIVHLFDQIHRVSIQLSDFNPNKVIVGLIEIKELHCQIF